MRTLCRFAPLLLWLACSLANAHTRSETFSLWEVSGSDVRVTWTVPEIEVTRLDLNGMPGAERLGAYLVENTRASSGQVPCISTGHSQVLVANKGFRRIEVVLTCARGAVTVVESSAFFELVPTHIIYARIRQDGSFAEQLFTAEQRRISLTRADESAAASAGFLEYVWQGALHILTGPDHIAFLLGLMLIARRFRDLALVVTGFTLGHSLTLALGVTGVLQPQSEYIDVLIALTIGLIGAENAVVASGRPGVVAAGVACMLLAMAAIKLSGVGLLPAQMLLGAALFSTCYLMLSRRVHDAALLRGVVTVVFGLIHGFAFANNLIEMKVDATHLAKLLVSFNLGVELGQLGIVVAVFALVALIRRMRLALPRPLVVDGVSSALAGLAVFWIVGRTYA